MYVLVLFIYSHLFQNHQGCRFTAGPKFSTHLEKYPTSKDHDQTTWRHHEERDLCSTLNNAVET